MPSLQETKRPTSNDNYIGVEIEFYSPCQSSSELGLDNHRLANLIQVGGDGSIRAEPGMVGQELKLLSIEKEFASNLKTIVDVLVKKGAKVNNSCGLHLHFDMRNRNVRKAYYNLIDANDFVVKTVSNERQTNKYCIPSMKESFYDQKSQGHHCGVNASAYDKYKTIEIRFHEATLDADEIIMYAEFMLKIINSEIFRAKNKFTLDEVDGFCDALEMGRDMREWLVGRIEKSIRPEKDINARIHDDEIEIQNELDNVG